MANNDFSNVNLDDLVDVTEADFGDMAQSVEMVDVPVATKSVFDVERGNMEQVPIDFDEDDFNFAMRTQRDNVDKANFMGKTEVGDLSSDVDDYFALVEQESNQKQNQDGLLKKYVYGTSPALGFVLEAAKSPFGKGVIGFGQSIIENIPKGNIRSAETELEDIKRGYREVGNLEAFKDVFSGDRYSLPVDYVLEKGNIDLFSRPQVRNDDGSISTVRSMSFRDKDDKEVLLPTISDDGRILSDEEAINQYYETGKHLGKFETVEQANAYAERLHRQQEFYYNGRNAKAYTVQEAINMTDDAKAERIAKLEANIKSSRELIQKSKDFFEAFQLDPNASEFDKFMYGLGNASASVGYSFGVAAITKNPTLAAVVIAGSFGKLQLEDTYEKAREKGVAPKKAEEMGLSTAAVSGALEMFGFKWLEKAVKANTIFKRITKGFMTEALQEGSQQAAVEAMESAYGIDVKTWDEIAADALYSAAIGGLTGAATGGISVAFDKIDLQDEKSQQVLNEFVNANQNPISDAERSEILKQEIVNRLAKANPDLEEETINNLAQDIVERANGSTTKAIMAINQVITKEVNFDTNDFTFDVWLAQVKKNLIKRGYTAEQIEEKAKAIMAKQDIRTGFSQVYEQAKTDIEKGNLGRSETEVEQAATLLAANAVGMHKQYGQGKTVLDYYKNLNVSFEKGMENRLQENPNAYATQPMAQELPQRKYGTSKVNKMILDYDKNRYDPKRKEEIKNVISEIYNDDVQLFSYNYEMRKDIRRVALRIDPNNIRKDVETKLDIEANKLEEDRKKFEEEKQRKLLNLKLPKKININTVANILKENGFSVSNVYTANTGSQYITVTDSKTDGDSIKISVRDHYQHTSDRRYADTDYDLMIDYDDHWVDEFLRLSDNLGLKGSLVTKARKYKQIISESDNIYYQSDMPQRKVYSVFDLKVGDKTRELGTVEEINRDRMEIKIGGRWESMLRVDAGANRKGLTIVQDKNNLETTAVEENIEQTTIKKVLDDRTAVNEQKVKNSEYNEIAEGYFGITNNLDLGGYILTDGNLLDLSGKKFGSDGRTRSIDHREISDAWENNDVSMEDFINSGNIRYLPESNSILMADIPNAKQYKIISQIIDRANGEVTVELMSDANNWGSYKDFSRTYENLTLAKLKRDINAFYKGEGVSEITKFYQDNAGTQQTGAGRRGEIERTAQGYVIRLFEQADPSTLFHEMWHLFTFQLQEAAKTSDRAKADWEVLANWSGYNQAITPEEKRAALERMARGGEQYLMKGKAPSNRLKFAFENFKQWLIDVYGSIKNLNVEINYDVEKVFNRLVGGKSLDYAFVSEKTELGQELKRMRQKNIDAIVSGRYIINDQTQMREVTGIERMQALTQSIIDLTKMRKGKDLLLVISDNLGDQTIEDIGNLIKTTKMRLPRKGDTLYTKMIKEGGITKELDRQYDITGLMGLERNDKLVRKPTKKEKIIGANGEENIVWSKDKPKPIETEEDLLEFLKKNKLLEELPENYTYDDLDAEWLKAMNILENAPTTYLDNGARKIAEDAVTQANRILEDIFKKPVAEIEEDYENFLEINRDFDIVSKDMLQDIRGLAILIERETNRLQRLIKKEALEDARAVRDDIIGLLERSIPAAQRSAFMKYISEIDTYERLISRLPNLVNRIVALQEKMFNDKIYRRIENVLKWSKSYKDSSGKRVSKFRDGDVQDFMDEAAKLFLVKNQEKASEMIEKLLPSEETVMNRENVFKVKLLQVASKLKDTPAENYLDVYNVLLDTYKAGKFAGEAEKELRKEKEQKLAESAYNIITKIKPEEKGLKKDIKQKIKAYFYSLQGWEDLMDILSGGDKTSKEYQSDLSKAARVLSAEVAERGKVNQWGNDLTKFVGEALGGKDDYEVIKYVNRLGEKIELGTFDTERETKWGTKTQERIEMSKDEMIDFYMKWKDEGSRKAILSKNGNGYTEEMANMIINNLTQDDLRVADALFDFYRSTRDEVFEAYRDEYGVSLGKVEFYSPRYREVNGDIESYFRGNIKSVTTGRVKERSDSATGAIEFLGAFKTADRYIAEVGHYTAWRKKMRDLNVIFGDKDVRSAIRERFGNDIIKIIDKQIQDFATNGKNNAKTIDKIMDAFRINFTVTALSLKPAQTPKQITSIFAFMEYVPTKEFLKDVSYAISHFKEVKAILDESPLVKTRFSNMQLEVNELANKHAVQRFIKSPKLQEFMMLPVKLGDVGAIYVGGWSVYAHALRQGKSKQEAFEIFERAANSSQQSSYLSELSEWQRGSSFNKLFTMFASSQNQYLRKEIAAIRNLINGRVDKTTAVKKILIYHFLLPMLFQWVCDLGRWDAKAQLRVALIGSLNGMFLLKDIYDVIIRTAQSERVFDQTLSIYGTLNELGKKLGKAFKTWLNNPDIEDIMISIKDLGVAGGEAFGLPFGQVENLWEGATNVWEGNVVEGLEILAGWTPYAVENAEGGLPKDIVEAFE